jgi:uncharacterized protein YgbK (DUF1537 family)
MSDLLFAFYGDDFTGSTDAMDALDRAGVPTVLFLEPPDADDLAAFDGVRAVGIAGASRSMTPAEMDAALPRRFEALDNLGVPLVHYKVCSTFDSSPEVGSIGHAIDLAEPIFDSPYVPLAVGVPPLERYVAFGNLFATAGGDAVHRIDRHPTMSEHPITPMDESDLRRHLGEQTEKSTSLLDVRALEGEPRAVDDAFAAVRSEDGDVVVFDTLTREHLSTVGRLLWESRTDPGAEQTLFAVGSSGVEYALADRWQAEGRIEAPEAVASPGPVDRLLVVSGSASPVTNRQIERATDAGFAGVRLDTVGLVDPDAAADARREAVDAARTALDAGESVVLYSALGPDDPAIEATADRHAEREESETSAGERLGEQMGEILRTILAGTELERVCVAGGDTCGHVTPALSVYALESALPVAPGAPLCRAFAREDDFDGLELALKGGQLGGEDYFERIRRGHPDDRVASGDGD